MNIQQLKEINNYESFIMFGPSVNRTMVNDPHDILLKGSEVTALVEDILFYLSNRTDVRYKSVVNTMSKFQRQIELIMDNQVAITKFLPKYWQKNRLYGDIGDRFCKLNILVGARPNYINDFNSIIATKKCNLDEDFIPEEEDAVETIEPVIDLGN